MDVKRAVTDVPSGTVDGKRVLGYVPITVVAVWAVAWFLASNGIRYEDVFGFGISLVNPAEYTLTMLFHLDWNHFAGNMELWIPTGVLLTLLTNNRHVLLIIVTSHFLAQVVGIATGQFGVGFSSAALAAMAALLVRTIGVSFQNASDETLQTAVATMLMLACTALLMIAVLAGSNTTIAYFHHFFGFLFGGAIESMYVFRTYGSEADDDERSIPKHLGR